MKRKKITANFQGFTLLEIMIVVVIIGVLAALVVPNIVGRTHQAQVVRAKTDLQTLEGSLNLYKLDNFNFPSTEQGLEALVRQPGGDPPAKNWKSGGYVTKLPKDPWGNLYQYLSPGSHGKIDIFSLGADAQVGGEGEAADIGNWNADAN